MTIVYGGGSTGLMGAVADAAMAEGGTVWGIIPQQLVEWEHQHTNISELEVVPDMHTRKKRMYERCDAALILPGGFGTLDELFELMTWNQLSIHQKPIIILNTEGFYQHLLQHMYALEAQGFLYEKLDHRLHVVNDPEELDQLITLIRSTAALE